MGNCQCCAKQATSEDLIFDSFDDVLKHRAAQKRSKVKELSATLPVLADLTKDTCTINGACFTQLVMAGFVNVVRTKLNLNKINVFPIPDGDTGNNIVICLKNPTKGLYTDPQKSVSMAAANLAADVLLYGQGNSGTILSHFFIQLSEEIKKHTSTGQNSISVEKFALAVSAASKSMQDAVPNVVEGTMVSVARDCGQDLAHGSLHEFINAWLAKGKRELELTPERLQVDGKFVLKEAGVVDSGAKGFVDMIEGMSKAIAGDADIITGMTDGKILSRATLDAGQEVPLHVDHTVTDSKFQFCTEAVVALKEGKTKQDALNMLEAEMRKNILDSLAAAVAPAKTGGQMLKVHFHTNDPTHVFKLIGQLSENGGLYKEKVEDMYAERELEHGGPTMDLSKAKFVVATDHVGSSLPEEIKLTKLIPIYVIPQSSGEPLTIGDLENFPPLELFLKLRAEPERCFTAAPTPINVQFILEDALKDGQDVIALSLAGWGSATCRTINLAREKLPPDSQARVTVVDSGYLGCEQTMMMKELLRCAANGMGVKEALECMKHVENRSYHLWFMSGLSMQALVKSGRVKDLGDGSGIADDAAYVRGNIPRRNDSAPHSDWGMEGAIGVERSTVKLPAGSDPKTTFKMKNWMGAVEECPPGDEAYEQMLGRTFKKIKEALKPKHILKDVVISSVGRPDLAHKMASRVRAALPVYDSKISVCDAPLTNGAWGRWGDIQLTFWIDDVDDGPSAGA